MEWDAVAGTDHGRDDETAAGGVAGGPVFVLVSPQMGENIGAAARAVPMMLCALSAWHAGLSQIVILGQRDSAPALDLERELAAHYLPFAIHVPVTPGASAANDHFYWSCHGYLFLSLPFCSRQIRPTQ